MSEQSLIECVRACLSAGEDCCLRHFESARSAFKVQSKTDGSPVSVADKEAEQAIRAELEARFPRDGIWGEEMGRSPRDASEPRPTWIIDPIDGTRAFIGGFPMFGVLLARLSESDALQVCAVSMPALGRRRFLATREGEAWEEDFRGKKVVGLQTSACRALSHAQVYVGEAERVLSDSSGEDGVRRVMSRARSVRYGHDCYLYVRLAAGGLDVVVESGLKPYDFLPLVLLVERAGGVISDWRGEPLGLDSEGRVLACASRDLQREVLACLAEGRGR